MTRSEKRVVQGREAMRVWLLGSFRVAIGDRTIEKGAWRLRKAAALVKLLALASGHRMHREQIMDLLWPASGRNAASNSLRKTLHAVRKVLDPHTGARYLASEDDSLVLCPDGDLWVDVDAFEEAASTARGSPDPAAYRAALELYAGELLSGDRYEGWAEEPRGRLRESYLSLLVGLARLHEERGDYEPAVEALRRCVAEELTREEAHVGLMRLYAHSGSKGEALAQYGRLEGVLLRELGTEPSASSRALREEIAAGRFPPEEAPSLAHSPEEAPGAPKHNLPAARTSFVGREREMLEVKRALVMTRLLTLTGVGGSGKTRLALDLARDLVGAYPDGVWFVELAPLSEGALVPQAVAKALRIKERPGEALTDTLTEVLRTRQTLVVLDNCEHLVKAVAQVVDILLDSCPRLRIIATSREGLDIPGEIQWLVSPLQVPDTRQQPTVADLERYESVRLFAERARYRNPAFALTPQNVGYVAEICKRLDGIPLAIELAAARIGLSVEQIASRLDDSLGLLTSGSRTATARQRTLRGALEWSYDLLSGPERALFARLSVFAGGWTLESAEAVASGEGLNENVIFDLLSGLVDKSLAVAGATGKGGVRYRMLEPIRQYAAEKLEEGGEAESLKRAHAEHFLSLAEEAEPALKGPDQVEWLGRLEAEHDNMRVALTWALQQGEAELALGLGGALWSFWWRHGYYSEGRRWLEEALAVDGRRSPQSRAMALAGLGMLASQQGDVDSVQEACEGGLDLLAQAGSEESWAKIYLLSASGYAALSREDYERATQFYEGCVELSRQMRDDWAIAYSLFGLALVSHRRGDPERTAELYEESMDLFRELGDKHGLAYGLNNLGLVERSRGDLVRAEKLTEECVALLRELGAGGDAAEGLCNLGWMALLRNDLGKAADLYEETLTMAWDIERNPVVTSALKGFACLAGAHGEAERAARLWGAAQTLLEGKVVSWDADFLDFLAEAEAHVSRARSDMGEEAWEEAWSEGRAMTTEEAVRYASSEKPAPPSDSAESPTVTRTDSLTHREREIAELVAQGLINHQIASELFISEHTVATHVRRILKKLGLQSRVQIGSWLAERRGSAQP